MTRRIDEEAMQNKDLDIITDFLANELDPAQVADVRRRLEEEPAFRDFAAPIVAAWNVAPRWRREPPESTEIVLSWDRFTKLARFTHQRRKRGWWWTLVFFVVLMLLPWLSGFFPEQGKPFGLFDFGWETVRDSAGVATLPSGTRVILEPGARLKQSRNSSGLYAFALQGSARFVIALP